MKWSWKIARIAGIDVFVHASFGLILLWVMWTSVQRGENLAMMADGVLFTLLIFLIVVLHEYGHALTARMFGIGTRDIILLPIGGVARLERMPDDPGQEFLVAIAGPLVNVALAALCFMLSWQLYGFESLFNESLMSGPLLPRLMWVNVVLAVFNMLPAFPMDGGRVLRALLAVFGSHLWATQVAARVGQVMAVLLGIWGFMGNPFMVLIAFFVWSGAASEAKRAVLRAEFQGLTVAQAMLAGFRVLAPDDPVEFALRAQQLGSQQDFPVVDDGRLLGIVYRTDILRAVRQFGSTSPAHLAMTTGMESTSPSVPLIDVVPAMTAAGHPALPVLDKGRLVGLLTQEKANEQLALRRRQHQQQAPNLRSA